LDYNEVQVDGEGGNCYVKDAECQKSSAKLESNALCELNVRNTLEISKSLNSTLIDRFISHGMVRTAPAQIFKAQLHDFLGGLDFKWKTTLKYWKKKSFK
jgi:hypothetical protein